MLPNEDVVGVGVDIVEMERVKSIRFLGRFAEYFLTPSEITIYKKSGNPKSFIASRFAAKEATIKAFPGFLKPHDFEIQKEGKKPVVRFVSPVNEEKYKVLVSMSHSTRYAAGYAAVVRK